MEVQLTKHFLTGPGSGADVESAAPTSMSSQTKHMKNRRPKTSRMRRNRYVLIFISLGIGTIWTGTTMRYWLARVHLLIVHKEFSLQVNRPLVVLRANKSSQDSYKALELCTSLGYMSTNFDYLLRVGQNKILRWKLKSLVLILCAKNRGPIFKKICNKIPMENNLKQWVIYFLNVK